METLLEIACIAARAAGTAIMEHYAVIDFDTKHDGSPVTIADHTANAILLEILGKTGIPILSEESTGIPLPYPDELWIIDPLDGTHDFINKTGDFSVMIGLLHEGRPVLGVVYAPVSDTLYFATKGGGAWHVTGEALPERLSVPQKTPEVLRGIRSRNHHSTTIATILDSLGAVLVPSRGSVGIKAALIAEGEADVYLVAGKLGEWDTCGPEIILTEAGGVVTDFKGNPLEYGNTDHKLKPGTLFIHHTHYDRAIAILSETLLPTIPVW